MIDFFSQFRCVALHVIIFFTPNCSNFILCLGIILLQRSRIKAHRSNAVFGVQHVAEMVSALWVERKKNPEKRNQCRPPHSWSVVRVGFSFLPICNKESYFLESLLKVLLDVLYFQKQTNKNIFKLFAIFLEVGIFCVILFAFCINNYETIQKKRTLRLK